VSISSDGEEALITGDCAHHPVQFAEPDWYTLADGDPVLSSATRKRLREEYADRPVLLIGTHFPPPSAGHLATVEGSIRFQPASR
jgi:glyoxylase-like metal-dependent hydrolase (beta-lactamase superfamily II)